MTWSTRRELARRGYTRARIEAALESGALIRVRPGHYCTPDADPSIRRAIRVGGHLTCVSELRRRGVWVVDGPAVHVRVAPHASRLRPDAAGTVLHWGAASSAPASADRHVSIVAALADAVGCLDHRNVVASLDSALHQRLVSAAERAELRSILSIGGRRLLDLADRRAESGLESIVRVLVTELGLDVRPQVRLAGRARVDLLVEGRVIVETDGDAFHDEKVTTRDRRRDAILVAQGFTVLRFRYAQVVYELESVARAIIAAVGTHRGIPRSGERAARARLRLERVRFS